MKSFFCIDLQRFMLIPTKFPLSQRQTNIGNPCLHNHCRKKLLEWCFLHKKKLYENSENRKAAAFTGCRFKFSIGISLLR